MLHGFGGPNDGMVTKGGGRCMEDVFLKHKNNMSCKCIYLYISLYTFNMAQYDIHINIFTYIIYDA